MCDIYNFNLQLNSISYDFDKQNGIAWNKGCSFIRHHHNISLRQQGATPFSTEKMFVTARVREFIYPHKLFCITP